MRLSDDALPCESERYAQSWKRHHPGWEFCHWTLADLPPLANHELFNACPNTGYRSDILRYELLHRFGGVYVDLDFECLRPLDPLLDGMAGFAGTISPRHRDIGVQTVETAILGSVPGSPFFRTLIDDLPSWTDWWGWHPSVAVRSGPQYFEKQLQRWRARRGSVPITLFRPDIFYPFLWDEPHRRAGPFPQSYAVHHWWGTWRR